MILHTGPISNFVLHIPDIFLDSFEEVDQWMVILSRNGVKELILTNSNRPYQLPFYVFSCLELTKLELQNCFFKPPLEFEGFPNLEELNLQDIDFGVNLSGTRISLPQLKDLSLLFCTNVHNFNIMATKLQTLRVSKCPDAMLLQLLHSPSPCLTHVIICFLKPIEENVRVERMPLAMVLSRFPNVEGLLFDGLFFKFWITANIPKWLPHAIDSLKRLSLLYIELGDLDQLEGALCLLRNSPNLEILTVAKMRPGVIDYDVGPALDYLEVPNCLECTLNRLKTVEIKALEGSRQELLFIKLLLAHSPSLEKMTITPSRAFDVQKRLNIAKDVMQFPRASPKAKLFYLDT